MIFDSAEVLERFLSRFTMPNWTEVRWVVSYGRGVRLTIYDVIIHLSLVVPHRDTGIAAQVIMSKHVLMPENETHAELVARDMMLDYMNHEIDEHLFFDGARMRDPHEAR